MPLLIDQERVLVGPVTRAAVFDDAQPAGRNLIGDPVIQRDDAVRHVLFQPLSRERVGASLAGDHRRDAALLEPRKQPAQLGAQHGGVAQAGEQRLDRVEDDALGADRAHRVVQPDEQPFQIVLAGLLDFGALDPDVLDRQALATDEVDAGRSRASRTLSTRSCSVSSKVTKSPGSPIFAPCVRKARAKSVLPHPGPPHTSVGRPSGTPPSVISSNPSMPVGTLRSAGPGRVEERTFRRRTVRVAMSLQIGNQKLCHWWQCCGHGRAGNFRAGPATDASPAAAGAAPAAIDRVAANGCGSCSVNRAPCPIPGLEPVSDPPCSSAM